MIIPGTSKEIILHALETGQYTLDSIAKQSHLSLQTLRSILAGKKHHRNTAFQLLLFYTRFKYFDSSKKAKVVDSEK